MTARAGRECGRSTSVREPLQRGAGTSPLHADSRFPSAGSRQTTPGAFGKTRVGAASAPPRRSSTLRIFVGRRKGLFQVLGPGLDRPKARPRLLVIATGPAGSPVAELKFNNGVPDVERAVGRLGRVPQLSALIRQNPARRAGCPSREPGRQKLGGGRLDLDRGRAAGRHSSSARGRPDVMLRIEGPPPARAANRPPCPTDCGREGSPAPEHQRAAPEGACLPGHPHRPSREIGFGGSIRRARGHAPARGADSTSHSKIRAGPLAELVTGKKARRRRATTCTFPCGRNRAPALERWVG